MAAQGHEIISGTIGMGKSYWVLHKIIKSLQLDRPCCYIDPKGETYRNLLSFFIATPEGRELYRQRRHRILFLNPVSKSGSILGFNAIAPIGDFDSATPDKTALLANSVVSHIRKQSGFELAEANRMQNIMSAAIATLLDGGGGQLTLAELPLLFSPSYHWEGKKRVADLLNPFTAGLLKRVDHIGTRSFWQEQWALWPPDARRQWVQSTEGRIFQYLFDERLLMTTCTVNHVLMII